jgi:hypothetical protein
MDRKFVTTLAVGITATFAGTWLWLDGVRYYPNCDWAWSLGAAPIKRGDPGYREQMDGDGDGIACEPYHGRFR